MSKTSTPETTVTLTCADLLSLAEKVAGHELSGLSKPAALNMIAATVLGPKHDWAFLKNSDRHILSQRSRQQELSTGGTLSGDYDFDLVDEYDGSRTGVTIDAKNSGDLHIETDDGQTVWVERNDACLKVHLYTTISDGPVSIWSKPDHKPLVNYDGFKDVILDEFRDAPTVDTVTNGCQIVPGM